MLNSSGPGNTENTPQAVASPSVHETPAGQNMEDVKEETKDRATNLLNQSVQNTTINQLGKNNTAA